MSAIIDHVAILLPSLGGALAALEAEGLPVGARERFEAEGTEEAYVGAEGLASRLLLMAPAGPGAYERALRKRGPGLHHLALEVEDLGAFLERAAEIGWLLHPASLASREERGAVYCARPGVGTLLEVEEIGGAARRPFVEGIRVPVERGMERFIRELGIAGLEPAPRSGFSFTIAGKDYGLRSLLEEAARAVGGDSGAEPAPPATEYSIRPLGLESAEAFWRLVDGIRDEGLYLFHSNRTPRDRVEPYVRAHLEAGNPILGAFAGGVLVGWIDINPGSFEEIRHVGVLGMGVAKAHRGRGLGRRLLEEAVAGARRLGLEKLELEVFEGNTAARALYARLGFAEEGAWRGKRKFRGAREDLVCMGLFL